MSREDTRRGREACHELALAVRLCHNTAVAVRQRQQGGAWVQRGGLIKWEACILLDHHTVVEGGEFLDLARRFARVHEQPNSAGMVSALYGLCTEGGSLLWRAITSGQVDTDAEFVDWAGDELKTKRDTGRIPPHRRARRNEVLAGFLDPFPRILCGYAERYLADRIELPPDGLGQLDNRACDESQTRVLLTDRAIVLGQCCRVLAAKLTQQNSNDTGGDAPAASKVPAEAIVTSSETQGTDKLLTVTRAAEITGLSTGDISRKCNHGKLVTNGKTNHARRIDRASVTKLEERLFDEGRIKILPGKTARTRMLRNVAPKLRNKKT